jgi:hypothetical protein
LPEAVVAQLLLGDAPPVTGAESPPDVPELLLTGRLPVRPDDLPFLAERLDVESDPRVKTLQECLRRIPPATEIPAVPAFRRRLVGEKDVEGWARSAAFALHYQIPASALLDDTAAGSRATLATPADRAAFSRDAIPTDQGMTRIVQVPDVSGFFLCQ